MPPPAVATGEDMEAALLPTETASSSSPAPATPVQPRSPDGRPLIVKTVSNLKQLPQSITKSTVKVVKSVKEAVDSAGASLHLAIKETASPEGVARITSSTWSAVKSDLAVCCHASHDMIVLWLCTADFKELDIEAQYRHWSVRYNPLYWLTFLPLVPCLVLGKWLHACWGQGDMMRPDETMEESRVRLHWIYCLDGPIAAVVLLDLVDVLFDVPFYTQRKFQNSLLSWSMTLTVTSAYILANSYFLDVMRRRSLVGVRLVIVYQTVFAVGLLNMLVAGAVHNKQTKRNGEYIFSTWLEFAAWSSRLVMVMFMLGAAFVYSRLWNIYRDQRQLASTTVSFHEHGSYLRRECLQYMILPIAAILMWLLLLLAASLDDDIFWDALI